MQLSFVYHVMFSIIVLQYGEGILIRCPRGYFLCSPIWELHAVMMLWGIRILYSDSVV